MPTTDELQSQINALQSQLNSILGMADDDYIHQYSGEEIDAGITAAAKAVRYDQAQSLTTAQQTQARGNIAAAPGGYGLGGNAKNLTADDNIDDCKTTGWYMWDWNPANQPAGLPNAAKYHVGLMRVEAATVGSGDACQTIYFPKSTGTDNTGDQCTIQRMGVISGAWNPFEWINPPLALGVEYRTTERYLGKPVYVKLVNPVHAAMTSETAVDLVCYFGVSNIAAVVSCVPVTGEWKNGAIVSPINNVPFLHSIATSSNLRIVCTGMATNYVRYNFSGYDGDYGFMPLIKYTKTTD